jgi:hypothetical protein
MRILCPLSSNEGGNNEYLASVIAVYGPVDHRVSANQQFRTSHPGKAIFGLHSRGIAFEVFVHFGTFLAVLIVFWRDVWNIFKAWGYTPHHPSTTVWLESHREDPFFRPRVLISFSAPTR